MFITSIINIVNSSFAVILGLITIATVSEVLTKRVVNLTFPKRIARGRAIRTGPKISYNLIVSTLLFLMELLALASET